MNTNTTNHRRVIMLVVTGIIHVIFLVFIYRSPVDIKIITRITQWSIAGLIIFEIMFRSRKWLNLSTLPIYIIVMSLANKIFYNFTYMISYLYFLVDMSVMIGIAYYLIKIYRNESRVILQEESRPSEPLEVPGGRSFTFRQFIKDGLVGVAIGMVIFTILTPSIYYDSFFGGTYHGVGDYISQMFFIQESWVGRFPAPMLFVFLAAFSGVGIGGRSLEKINSRKEWIRSIYKITSRSWVVEIGLLAIYFGVQIIIDGDLADVGFAISSLAFIMIIVMIPSGIGAIVSFLVGSLAGVIFNPQKRLYKIVIGAISSVLVGYSVQLGIMAWMGVASG